MYGCIRLRYKAQIPQARHDTLRHVSKTRLSPAKVVDTAKEVQLKSELHARNNWRSVCRSINSIGYNKTRLVVHAVSCRVRRMWALVGHRPASSASPAADEIGVSSGNTGRLRHTPPSRKTEDTKVFRNDIEIQKVYCCKYLGIYVDAELNWKIHIDHIFNKLIKFTVTGRPIFYKIRIKLSPGWMKSIDDAFVYPHLLYGIEIYANTFDTYLDRLRKLNHKILRIIQSQPQRCHVLDLYNDTTCCH